MSRFSRAPQRTLYQQHDIISHHSVWEDDVIPYSPQKSLNSKSTAT